LGACLEGAQTVGGRERVSVRQGGTGEVEGDEGTSFFYVVGQGWERAGELKSGEKLVGAKGNLVAIEGVELFKVRGLPYSEKR